MKCFIPCLAALPLLTSCIAQETYYQSDYYAPPPPHVEVHRHYQSAPGVRVEQHSQNTNHGHEPVGARAVVVSPRTAGVQIERGRHIDAHSNEHHKEGM